MHAPTVRSRRSRSFPVLLASLAVAALLAAPAHANPIAPALQACDGDGHVYLLYVVRSQGQLPTSWWAESQCDLPTVGTTGAADIAVDLAQGIGVAQGREGTRMDQLFNPFWGTGQCSALSPPVANGFDFSALEYAGSVLYATFPTGLCDASILGTLEPRSGAFHPIGPVDVPGIRGLAFDDDTFTLYAIASCAPAPSLLYAIDPTSGAATLVGSTQVVGLVSIEFSSRYLFGGSDATDQGRLYLLDRDTGAATPLAGDPAHGMREIAGLAVSPYGVIVPADRPSWGRLKIIYR